MVAFQEIQDTLRRMEEQLDAPLDVQALAAEAHLSPYYFQRLFSRLVGRPIAEYQKQRRLARSLDLLRDTNRRILDIALSLGFQSHETFIRAFKDAFGMTPDEFRKSERHMSGFTPVLTPDVTMAYQLVDEGMPLVADGIVLEISRRTYSEERLYAGFRVSCPTSVPNNFNPGVTWDYFSKGQTRNIPFLHIHGDHAGIGGEGPNGFTYLAGCQVTEIDPAFTQTREWPGFGALPDYLAPDYARVPSGVYLICTFTAEDFSHLVIEAIEKAYGYFMSTFIPRHGIKTEGPMIEMYDERCLRWHPVYRYEDDVRHLEARQPKLSQWEGPEMEIQVKMSI